MSVMKGAMGATGSIKAAVLLLAGVLALLGAAPAARAELKASIAQRLMGEVVGTAMTTAPAGRAFLERALGDRMLSSRLTAYEWEATSERLARILADQQSYGTAEEFYLRTLRLEKRFRMQASKDSPLLQGTGKPSADDLALLQKIASEELALKGATWVERVRGIDPISSGRIEFISVRRTATTFNDRKATFLSGDGRAGESAYERSLKLLAEQARQPEMTYLLFQTPEGRAILRIVLGPNPVSNHALEGATGFVDKLGKLPELRDLSIQLAFRMEEAMGMFAKVKAKLKLKSHGDTRHGVLNRMARDYLRMSETSVPGAIEFMPSP